MLRLVKRALTPVFGTGLLLVFALAVAVTAESGFCQQGAKSAPDKMAWWTEARFGLFIHWGLYAQPARGEWVRSVERISDEDYRKYFELFNPDLYDPVQWARTAKKAGMKYFVITTKHHEGFCLWDSKLTDYKAPNTPCGKDLLRPMVEAFRNEGLKVGFYYSLIDWHHPDFTLDENHPMYDDKAFAKKAAAREMARYDEYLHAQVRELLTEFGRIDYLFLDYSYPGKGRNEWQSEKLLKMIRELQPDIIVNDRLDLLDVPGGWDFRTPEQFMPRQWVQVDGKRVPWETCQTLSGWWGYDRDGGNYKSVRQLIAMLIETVSKGGNLLLNVGPTARGTFDYRAMNALNGIGEWMALNGRSIYGCTQAPEGFKTPANCLLTYNSSQNRLYVHVLEWPIGELCLDGFAGKIKYAQLLNDASELKMIGVKKGPWMTGMDDSTGGTLRLILPVRKPEVEIPVVELFLK